MKKTVLITGARGFIGRNLAVRLRQKASLQLRELSRDSTTEELGAWAGEADVVIHLAGVNRTETVSDFHAANVDLTDRLVSLIAAAGNRPHFIFASSIQAALDNPYGRSKRGAEEVSEQWAREFGARLTVMRLKNVFGKWCRPNYNSVVATFCYNIARGLPIRVDNPDHMLDLVHVDDVVEAMIRVMESQATPASALWVDDIPSQRISVGDLADRIRAFEARAKTLLVPDMSDRFNRLLYGTFITYLEPRWWEYQLEKKEDIRGDLAEFIKSPWFGQIFISRTRPGVTRGNHYHHAKVEKFLVIAGSAVVRFRAVEGEEILEFPVRGEEYRVLEIPPGFTHSITNVGTTEMITLFWASEIFDSSHPDTTFLPVEAPIAVGQ